MTRTTLMRFLRIVQIAALTACSYYPQSYLPATHNWAFKNRFPRLAAIFNAFDYGHSALSKELFAHGIAGAPAIETREFTFVTRTLLVHPPTLPLDGEAIAPAVTRLAPEVALMFDWAHMLHRQLYDIWADERIPVDRKDAAVKQVVAYYQSRPDLAFSAHPKSMQLMEGESYSLGFRRACPKYNALIWSYHWLQMTTYDALIAGHDARDQRALVDSLTSRFFRMHLDNDASTPQVMPMTAAIAPAFATRYPEAAVIFDNLHAMHDVVSDILIAPSIPRDAKRRVLLAAAARFRDDTSSVISHAEWLQMARDMGAEQMGGVGVVAR